MAIPRIHLDLPLAAGARVALPAPQVRHIQVLRLQPGAPVVLFDGRGGEWQASVGTMTRSSAEVRIEAHVGVTRESARRVTIAVGMPANERMDALVEKATELGVAEIQPLVCERSVLRLAGERADRRLAHWRAIAVAASEQSGRTRLALVQPVQPLAEWLADMDPEADGAPRRLLLAPGAATPFADAAGSPAMALVVLSGPEGGLTLAEHKAAVAAGFTAVSLGTRVLRADTAPLAVLAWCALEPTPEPDR